MHVQSNVIGLLLSCAVSACGGTASEQKAVTPEAIAQATALYESRCARCHGSTGGGDGPEAAGLDPKPRNFRDATWQLAVSDRHLEQAIREGGPSVGKSAVMQANPDLAAQPELVAALRQHLRTLVGRD
jgi:mono/diheme cytochrome c family protein